MKGVSIAIETIIYLILGILVLTVLVTFFLTQAGPAQDRYTLESKRNTLCGTYVNNDFRCVGTNNNPVASVSPSVLQELGKTCAELNRRFGLASQCSGGSADIRCIQSCCITCPVRPSI